MTIESCSVNLTAEKQEEAHYHLIGAGDAQSKENWQEQISCQDGIDALSEAHVEEFKAIAKTLGGNTQNLDC